jgi:NADH:ubiquinone oxidoreductase subunit 4 (subunit M)
VEIVFCLVSIAVIRRLSVGGGVLVFRLRFILCAEFFKFSRFSDTPSFRGAMFFDHISYLMVVITFMVCIARIVSRCKDVYVGEKSGRSVRRKLGLETAVVSVTIRARLVFCVRNIFLFFFFFEFSLIPTFWLILG